MINSKTKMVKAKIEVNKTEILTLYIKKLVDKYGEKRAAEILFGGLVKELYKPIETQLQKIEKRIKEIIK